VLARSVLDPSNFDNDGYLDVMVVNGDGHRLSDTQEAILARNVPGPGGKQAHFSQAPLNWICAVPARRALMVTMLP